jgi:hypothetical protein
VIDPLPLSGFRIFDDPAEELDRDQVLGASLLPRVPETEPVVRQLNLKK